jgi:hypothetical protein
MIILNSYQYPRKNWSLNFSLICVATSFFFRVAIEFHSRRSLVSPPRCLFFSLSFLRIPPCEGMHPPAAGGGGGGQYQYFPRPVEPNVAGQPYYPHYPTPTVLHVPVHAPVPHQNHDHLNRHLIMTQQPQPSPHQPLVHSNPPPPAAPVADAPAPVVLQPPRPVQQQQQRAGPIIVGGSGITKATPTSTNNNSATTASTANSKNNVTSKAAAAPPTTTSNKFHPIGRCVSDSLAILRTYAPPASSSASSPLFPLSSTNKRKTPQDYMNVLERLVPTLLLCTKNNAAELEEEEGDDDEREGGERSMKRVKSDSCEKSGGGGGDDERHEDVDIVLAARNTTTNNNPKTTTTTSKQEYHTQLQKQLAQHVHENQKLLKRRQNVFQSLVRLHELYETGLDGIARMNDLTFVPDNVMPE